MVEERFISMFLFQVDQVGPVHDRTYTYSLTIGAQNSDDVLVSFVSLSNLSHLLGPILGELRNRQGEERGQEEMLWSHGPQGK